MKMRPTQGVSFPRSGHAPIQRIAKRYFKGSFVYCDTNNKKNCGCESVPCINPNRTYAKNHDFGLRTSPGVPVIPTEHYFIQYRNPVRSIVSHFYLYMNRNPDKNTREDWEKFAFRDVFYWNRFIDKWVLDFPAEADPPLYCTYESLLSDPETRVREILTYFSYEPLDEASVAHILSKLPIAPRDNLAKFEYYDTGLFRELEEAASERLAELDLPSFADGY
jgi:hypothetical protein